jgi:hypothetical protein
MRRPFGLVASAVAATVLALILGAGLAGAFSFDPGAEIVSASLERLEQGDDESTLAVISGNGRYVTFQTRARNFFADDDPDPPGQYRVGGIFRKDLVSGALELVADGDLKSSATDALAVRGAQNASISADGGFVAFSTAQQLVPEDRNANVDVYVRDMSVPARSPGAYELMSARDGGTVPASYAAPKFGSEVTPGRAISADGQKIVFKTRSASDLPAGSGSQATPTEQIFVRDRTARSTTLVTVTSQPPPGQTEPVPAGGADAGTAISADGTTVVWAGKNPFQDPATGQPGQTPYLDGENVFDRDARYYLWRRVADGPQATTRRITGAVDLEDPACPPGSSIVRDPTAAGPCYGPLNDYEDWNRDLPVSEAPALSADGYKVAFLVNPPLRPNNQSGRELDLFLTDMRPGLSRKAGTVELTRPGAQLDTVASSSITSLAMSTDGRYIAFNTVRTQFLLPSPRLVDPPAAVADVSELYVLDVGAMEIERVTCPAPVFEQTNPQLWNGGEVDGDTLAGLSISDDGTRIAFSSKARNLFLGDSNDRGDAFVADRGQSGVQDGAGAGGDLPLDLLPPSTEKRRKSAARIAVRVKRIGRGNLKVAVRVTDAGLIEARAQSRVQPRGRGPRSGRARLRTLATARRNTQRAGEVTLVLRTAPRYRALLTRTNRLTARLLVSFTPLGGGRKITARRAVALSQGSGRK